MSRKLYYELRRIKVCHLKRSDYELNIHMFSDMLEGHCQVPTQPKGYAIR